MKLLAIETSCDETSAAVVASDNNGGVELLSNVVASSMQLHSATGGIVPEVAAREQIKCIIPVINEALNQADIRLPNSELRIPNLDAIAVTYGPGLIGSLLVGVEAAKTLSFIWEKPLIPVNHLFGHIYANWLKNPSPLTLSLRKEEGEQGEDLPQFPLVALIVSGGHTDLLLMKSHSDILWLGGTRDDAAGEAFDKIGRFLGLSYPAGPIIEQNAKKGNSKRFHFPRPLMHDKEYDFSFSGLKTAVLREVERIKGKGESVKGKEKNTSPFTPHPLPLNDLCRATQDAIIDVLVYKTIKAAETYQVKSILLSGGVGANQTLRESFKSALVTNTLLLTTKLFVPNKSLCTDNAAMIGAAAIFRPTKSSWKNLSANPELYFD